MHHPLQVKLIRLYFWFVSRFFPSLAVYSAHRLFHYPVNSKRRYINEVSLPTAKYFNIPLYEGMVLQGYKWGEAHHPKVLLVHGWSTTSHSMTHFTDILLRNNYQVISFDALRHGESSGSFADLASWADSVRAVMEHVGEVECIIAHSFGGGAVTVASKLGLNTKKLLFIAPIHNVSSIAKKFADYLGIPNEIIEKMKVYTWGHNKSNFEKYGTDWEDIINSDFHVPTLIYHDKEDREVGIEHSQALLKKWTWVKLTPTQGLGHRKILDDETIAKEALAFIQSS